jgi:hypothetical protein
LDARESAGVLGVSRPGGKIFLYNFITFFINVVVLILSNLFLLLRNLNILLIKCRYMNTDAYKLALIPRYAELFLHMNGHACIIYEMKAQQEDDARVLER